MPESVPKKERTYEDELLDKISTDINRLEREVQEARQDLEPEIEKIRRETQRRIEALASSITEKERKLAQARSTQVLLKTGVKKEVPAHPLQQQEQREVVPKRTPRRPQKLASHGDYVAALELIETAEFTRDDVSRISESSVDAAGTWLRKMAKDGRYVRVSRKSEHRSSGKGGGKTPTFYKKLEGGTP